MSSELVRFYDRDRDVEIPLPVRSHKNKHEGVWYRGTDGEIHLARKTDPNSSHES